ncbi:hypothetical protein GCM10027416_07760 [Okibacterium endophyticum]
MVQFLGLPSDRTLDIYTLSDHLWRVCDPDVSSSDSARLLGYIQRAILGYDVFVHGGVVGHEFVKTFGEALIVMNRHRSRAADNAVPAIVTLPRMPLPVMGAPLTRNDPALTRAKSTPTPDARPEQVERTDRPALERVG